VLLLISVLQLFEGITNEASCVLSLAIILSVVPVGQIIFSSRHCAVNRRRSSYSLIRLRHNTTYRINNSFEGSGTIYPYQLDNRHKSVSDQPSPSLTQPHRQLVSLLTRGTPIRHYCPAILGGSDNPDSPLSAWRKENRDLLTKPSLILNITQGMNLSTYSMTDTVLNS
jgi:hypothetical protein